MFKKPVRLLFATMKDERSSLYTLLSYTLISSILSLVVPVGVQVLTNSLAAGVYVNPVLVISTFVLIGLIIFAFMQISQIVIVEMLQQKIFAKISIQLAIHIPKLQLNELKQKYSPSMANRFFEIITLQKSFSKIFLYWPSAVLQIGLGLILIGTYSFYLVIFIIAILLFIFAFYLIGRGAIETGINECTEKYFVADWLEDLARCYFTFKSPSGQNFVNKKTDSLVLKYLSARRSHFKIILRQHISYYFFYIFSSAGIFYVGGLLVINHKISIGQFVASELIMLNILKAMEIIISFIDNYYDLIAGIDKINSVLELKKQRNEGIELSDNFIDITCNELSFGYDNELILDNINLSIKPGQRVSLFGKSGIGKTTLAYLISGDLEPTNGTVNVNDINIKNYNFSYLRSKISVISNTNEIFKGTVEENIRIANLDCSIKEMQHAIKLASLDEDIKNFKDGLDTMLVHEGLNISLGQRLRILLARAILKKPYLLILDEAFLSTDEATKNKLIEVIYDKKYDWSILDISYDYKAVVRSDYIYAINDKKIVEEGSPKELFSKESGFVKSFFDNKHI